MKIENLEDFRIYIQNVGPRESLGAAFVCFRSFALCVVYVFVTAACSV